MTEREHSHDWRIVPNVILPTNPPRQALRCADCPATSSRPHPNFVWKPLPGNDPKKWERA